MLVSAPYSAVSDRDIHTIGLCRRVFEWMYRVKIYLNAWHNLFLRKIQKQAHDYVAKSTTIVENNKYADYML